MLNRLSSSSTRTRSLVSRRRTSVNRLFEKLRVINFTYAHFYKKAFGCASLIKKAFQEPKNNFFELHPD